ncbi:serine/threonine-protein kinase PIX13 [Populus alba x Populus x berolinensis]|uniref:Serine/threonine-protein kinase PIX13 n=1 Tax=Populus alba x Populus x berolinensis TaxID=444605 RepID=A0AAD6QHR3_9ROSI|nr:serine/threonine-protein kinase PIX13 [Populus alba x Populus x berolinensis]
MPKYQILAWPNWGLRVETHMCQPGSWELMVMLLLSTFATGHLYVKSDVYGFGVVLLEMLSGQRAFDTKRPTGQQNLIEWLKPLLSQKKKLKTTVMDARIEGQYSSKAMVQAAQLTLKCLEADPKNRPSMKEVVEVLEQIEAMKEKPKATKSTFGSSLSKPHRGGQQPNLHRFSVSFQVAGA